MTLAARVGLDVPPIDLVPVAALTDLPADFDRLKGTEAFVIERFDRDHDGERVHIEDINQVLAQWPENKYEGASYDGLGRLILTLCGEEDFWEYFRRLLFTIAIGNEDAHLKNWSITYPDRRSARLAPIYDVVSTIMVPDLKRGLALRFAGSDRPEAINRESLGRFADSVGVSASQAVDVAEEFLRRVLAEEPTLRDDERCWSSSEWDRIMEYRAGLPLIADL